MEARGNEEGERASRVAARQTPRGLPEIVSESRLAAAVLLGLGILLFATLLLAFLLLAFFLFGGVLREGHGHGGECERHAEHERHEFLHCMRFSFKFTTNYVGRLRL